MFNIATIVDLINVSPKPTSAALTAAAQLPTPERLRELIGAISSGLIGREAAIKAALLTLLAGENIVLIGPPGTGKSMVSRRVAAAIGTDSGATDGDSRYFEYLLTKFSTPEEIFGPLSLAALKNDRFERRTEGYLPSVRVAFLDEIFKASSSILNALLTILNERIYHNGPSPQRVPLRALIAASNELPTGQSELAALYDRFLVRHFVGYVDKGERRDLFNAITTATTTSATQAIEPLTAAELTAIDTAARAVTLPAPIVQALTDIWAAHEATFSENRDEHLSDRRMTKVLHLLRVSAATNGRSEVNLSDLMLLHHCLWNNDANREAVIELVRDTLKKHSRQIVLEAPTEQQKQQQVQPHSQTATQPLGHSTTTSSPTGQLGALFKDMKGRGTEDDPLLIETVEDLSELAKPEVGQKGYHFLQINDLDLSSLNAWKSFDFYGNYNGNCKEINAGAKWIFSQVKSGSTISGLILPNGKLASDVINDCIIQSISSFLYPVFNIIKNCKIENINCEKIIEKQERYLANRIQGCTIYNSTIQGALANSMDNSKIQNLLILDCLNIVTNSASSIEINNVIICTTDEPQPTRITRISGVVPSLFDASKKYLIDASKKYLSGLFINGLDIKFNNSVLVFGRNFELAFNPRSEEYQFILGFEEFNCVVKNCYITSRPGVSDSVQGATPLGFKLFTKLHIETRLGFDVENIWDCDNMVDGIPQLRFTTQLGLSSANTQTQTKTKVKAAQSQAPTVDLLFHQLKQNIWV